MSERDGGPAFPGLGWVSRDSGDIVLDGMTLRDYFAAKAMQATVDPARPYTQIAALAYQVADAMLKERAK